MEQFISTTEKTQDTLSDLNAIGPPETIDFENGLIRFEVKKESFIWVHPDQIMFVKSANHYVNALVQNGSDKKWVTRHSTLKELLVSRSMSNFIRLNRFYVVNKKYFSHIDFRKKLLFLIGGTSIPVIHRISSFIIETLKD
jgi:DNA-binding LytR/AlgR family response regulator